MRENREQKSNGEAAFEMTHDQTAPGAFAKAYLGPDRRDAVAFEGRTRPRDIEDRRRTNVTVFYGIKTVYLARNDTLGTSILRLGSFLFAWSVEDAAFEPGQFFSNMVLIGSSDVDPQTGCHTSLDRSMQGAKKIEIKLDSVTGLPGNLA
jgi:hypothetical protein